MAQIAVQRPQRGERLASFFPTVPEQFPSVFNIESAFQLQEYIALLIRHDIHDVQTIVSVPASVEDKTVDEACWIYEHLRRLAQDLTHPLITTLQQECTRQSCPEMKAGEWLYLCVAHGNGGTTECCAIDYILHTLDSATSLLTSSKAFPSRINIQPASVRHFSSLARRLSRIFAHAYFHHREAFEQAEADTSLYARFLALSQKFDLVPAEFLLIPARPPVSTTAAPPQLETGKGSSPGADSPGDILSPNTLARLGRPRTDTMYFSGDFNFMSSGGTSPSSQRPTASAATNPVPVPSNEPKAPLDDLREPDRTNASLDIFHSGFENSAQEEAPPPPRAPPVPLPEEAQTTVVESNPFADPEESVPAPIAKDFAVVAATEDKMEEIETEKPEELTDVDLGEVKIPNDVTSQSEPPLEIATEEAEEKSTESTEDVKVPNSLDSDIVVTESTPVALDAENPTEKST